jgi:ABC-type sugar transport system substrate-binding protein
MTKLVRAFCGAVGAAAMIAGMAMVAPARADEPIKVTFIDADKAGNPFFSPIRKGTADAGKEYGVDVDFQYADLDPAKLNDIVETAINNKVQGIVVQMYTPGAYKTSLEHARQAGITVISFNIDDPSETEHKYVGQDLEGAGYKIGQYLIAQAKLKKGDHVVAAAGDVNASDLGLRYKGVAKALSDAEMTSELIAGSFVAAQSQTLISQYLIGHPETNAVVGLDAVDTGAAPAAVADAGLKIPTVGFDVTPIIVDNIRKGLTLGSVDQQPYLQGFLPIEMIALKAKYGLSPFSVDTGDAIVDKSGVDFVQKYSGSYR